MTRNPFLCVLVASVLPLACGSESPAPSSPPAEEQAAPGEPQRIEADQIEEVLQDSNVILLDVRRPEEIEELGTIEGYYHIPIEELEARLDELPADKTILTA